MITCPDFKVGIIRVQVLQKQIERHKTRLLPYQCGKISGAVGCEITLAMGMTKGKSILSPLLAAIFLP